jgi:hypothetical protein
VCVCGVVVDRCVGGRAWTGCRGRRRCFAAWNPLESAMGPEAERARRGFVWL